ncbi:hypothetical protein CSKR_104496 [Clonorchis sinensis]|uniref:Uncharacterized protein n=1 Tax=Clonorchis sinensis TaxID=79923 RepID=A0A3R7D5X3_CLOSI|nr:hypothetical protein CSKR_104496 [Clonorchis sinensis]
MASQLFLSRLWSTSAPNFHGVARQLSTERMLQLRDSFLRHKPRNYPMNFSGRLLTVASTQHRSGRKELCEADGPLAYEKLTTKTPSTSSNSRLLQPLRSDALRIARFPSWKVSHTDSSQTFRNLLHTPLPGQNLATSLLAPPTCHSNSFQHAQYMA